MPRGPHAPDRMTRQELVAEVRRLRSTPGERLALEAVIQDLRTHQEELRVQHEQLVDAQRQLEQSRDIYADLYDYAPLPYVTLDEYGVVRNMNLTCAELLGRGRLALDRRPFTPCIDEPDRRAFLDHMRRCRQQPGPVISDITIVLASGERVPVQMTTRMSTPLGSAEIEYRTAIVDLRMLHAAELARAEAERERSRLMREEERVRDAMQAKDDFLAVLSHELRTPLTPILAAASVLRARRDVLPDVRDALTRIQRNVELETRLIDDLLDMTRAARGALSLNREIIDVHEVLRDTVEVCEADRPRGVSITWALGAAEHHAHADRMRLGQVFWNLVRNAFQSIVGDGELHLRSSNDGDGHVTLSVRDSGRGIEAADLERIFLPLYQPRAEGRGRLGLGLAISKSLIEAQDGRIGVKSQGRGWGACFEVQLAVASPVATDGRQAAATVPRLPLEAGVDTPPRLTILLVEDNADSADALSLALRLEGFDVRVADSVAAARAAAGERFDVLVSDLALPDGSGFDVITELRERSGVPAIALSGHGSSHDKSRSIAAGFAVHLTKPVTIELLSETIRGLAPAATHQPG